MHRKGAQDKKRSKIFSRLGREISVAVKTGGSDLNSNIRLKSAIREAKSLNMPKDNIERSIKREREMILTLIMKKFVMKVMDLLMWLLLLMP